MNKWKSILALIVIYIAIAMGWNWVWGILFLSWTVPSLYSGRTYLFDELNKEENPILFWLVIITWILLSAYLIVADVFMLPERAG